MLCCLVFIKGRNLYKLNLKNRKADEEGEQIQAKTDINIHQQVGSGDNLSNSIFLFHFIQ